MPEEPTENQPPETQSRNDRSWLLWIALAGNASKSADVVSVTRSSGVATPARPVDIPEPEELEAVEEERPASVPDVVGLMKSDAVGTLGSAGYNTSVTTVYSASKPRGVVFEQVPAGGASVDPGTTVRLLVSSGSQPTASAKVPSLVGLKRSRAVDRVEAAGLDPKVITQPRPSGNGVVFQQSPNSGSMVLEGSKVFIFVGLAP